VKRKSIIVVHSLAIVLLLFSYWGLFTSSGQKEFDEMDGIIPVFSGFIGVIIYLALLIRFIYLRYKKG